MAKKKKKKGYLAKRKETLEKYPQAWRKTDSPTGQTPTWSRGKPSHRCSGKPASVPCSEVLGRAQGFDPKAELSHEPSLQDAACRMRGSVRVDALAGLGRATSPHLSLMELQPNEINTDPSRSPPHAHTPWGWPLPKGRASFNEDAEKLEPSCAVGGNANWSCHYGEQCGGASEN